MATFLHIYEATFMALALGIISGLSLVYPSKYQKK